MPNDEGMTKPENPDYDFRWADGNTLRVREEADAKPVSKIWRSGQRNSQSANRH